MTWLASRETREARWAAEDADLAEREHRHHCPECTRAIRMRKPAERCITGIKLAREKKDTAAQLKAERELDRQPAPDQEPLFAPDEVNGDGDGT